MNLELAYTTGSGTLYALIYDVNGNVWNGTAFVAPSSITTYSGCYTACAEAHAGNGLYVGTLPSGATAAFTALFFTSEPTTATTLPVGAQQFDALSPTEQSSLANLPLIAALLLHGADSGILASYATVYATSPAVLYATGTNGNGDLRFASPDGTKTLLPGTNWTYTDGDIGETIYGPAVVPGTNNFYGSYATAIAVNVVGAQLQLYQNIAAICDITSSTPSTATLNLASGTATSVIAQVTGSTLNWVTPTIPGLASDGFSPNPVIATDTIDFATGTTSGLAYAGTGNPLIVTGAATYNGISANGYYYDLPNLGYVNPVNGFGFLFANNYWQLYGGLPGYAGSFWQNNTAGTNPAGTYSPTAGPLLSGDPVVTVGSAVSPSYNTVSMIYTVQPVQVASLSASVPPNFARQNIDVAGNVSAVDAAEIPIGENPAGTAAIAAANIPSGVVSMLIAAGLAQYVSGTGGPLQWTAVALAKAPTGGSIISQTPPIVPGEMKVFQYGAFVQPGAGLPQQIGVTDCRGNPISLAGRTVEILATSPANHQNILWKWTTNDALTIVGANSNVIQINADNTNSQTAGDFLLFAWDITGGTRTAIPEASVRLRVIPAPQPQELFSFAP